MSAKDEWMKVGCGVEKDKGYWAETSSGTRFYPLAFTPDIVDITDISHSLGHQCRYNGHTKTMWTVAQHCVACVDYVTLKEGWEKPYEKSQLNFLKHLLLHDAAEAYIGDMIRPLKHSIPIFGEIEKKIDTCLQERFELEPLSNDWSGWLREIDNLILVSERKLFLPNASEWPNLPDEDPVMTEIVDDLSKIKIYSPSNLFLRRFISYFGSENFIKWTKQPELPL